MSEDQRGSQNRKKIMMHSDEEDAQEPQEQQPQSSADAPFNADDWEEEERPDNADELENHADDNGDDDNDDDLFGDAGDEEEEEEAAEKLIESTEAASEEDEEEEERKANESYYDEDRYEDEDEEIEQRHMEITIPRYPSSHVPDKNTYFVRMPTFLTVDAHAFDSSSFLREAEERAQQDEQEGLGAEGAAERSRAFRLQNENTIRWKFARDPETGQMIKQSNARFIRWSDGSLSLQLGAEMFEVEVKDNPDTFLTMSHPQQEILQTTSLLDKSMTFIPYSTSSNTHIRLTEELKRHNNRGNTVGNIATTDDPEKLKLAALRAEEMSLKARRKLEQKRRQLEAREGYGDSMGGSSAPRRGAAGSSAYEGASGSGGASSRYDKYEDDDGFVVQDEDEDEEMDEQRRASRLKDVKRQGAAKYRKKRDYDDEDEEEEEEEFEDGLPESEEEEEAQFTDEEERAERRQARGGSHKKRRVIEEDEDDE